MMRTQFVALGGFAIAVVCSAGLGVASSVDAVGPAIPDQPCNFRPGADNSKLRVGVSGPDGKPLRDKHGKPFMVPMCPRPPQDPPDSVAIRDDANCRVEKNWRGVPGEVCEDGDCGFKVNKQDELEEVCEEPTPQRSTQTAKPESWTISPDSFGPVTTDMTRAQALATGAFRETPYPCPYRLDWHDQTYEPNEGVGGQRAANPRLSSIAFWDGKLAHIDPGIGVRTSTGIGMGDTVKQLRTAYVGNHIFYNDPTPMKGNYEAFYGINGRRSHLIFYVDRGIIEGLTLDPGLIDADHSVSDEGRGVAACP